MLDDKTVEKLKEGGFLRGKYDHYKDIYLKFKEAKKENGYCAAVQITMERAYASEDQVKRAVRSFKKMEG